jgi:hypothetical protein
MAEQNEAPPPDQHVAPDQPVAGFVLEVGGVGRKKADRESRTWAAAMFTEEAGVLTCKFPANLIVTNQHPIISGNLCGGFG